MQEKVRKSLRLVKEKPYKIDRNDRVKLPADWLADNEAPDTVRIYATADGDLLISTHDYTDNV